MPAPIPHLYKIHPTSNLKVLYISIDPVDDPSEDFLLHSGQRQQVDHFFKTDQYSILKKFVDRLQVAVFEKLTQYSDLDYIPVTHHGGIYTVHIVEGIKSVSYRRILRYGFVDHGGHRGSANFSMDMIFSKRLDKIMLDANTKTLNNTFKNTPGLKRWIHDQTDEYTPSNINERVYILTKGVPQKNKCGKYPNFNTYEKGYVKFCGVKGKCKCADEGHSDFMTEFNAEATDEFWENRSEKTRNTVFEEHGVTNVMHVPEYREKNRQTCQENFGADTPFESEIVQKKIKDINLENLGVEYPFQSPVIKDKCRKTARERYGDSFAPARAAFAKRNNGKNPFVVFREVVFETNLSVYGDIYPTRTTVVKEKRNSTVKRKYNVDNVSQLHIDPTSLDILNDPFAFGYLCQRYSFWELKDLLKVSKDIIWDRHDQYGFDFYDRSGRSDYEREIAEWLTSLKIPFKREQRFGLNCKSLDFVIDGRIAIEFNGLFAHSEYSLYGQQLKMHRNYHKEKFDQCCKIGLQLLTIFEDEWNDRKDVIKEKILTLLNRGIRGIPARKTEIKEVSHAEAVAFLERHHLQGSTVSTIRLGAYHNGKLIALMAFKTHKEGWDLVRFVNDNRSHPGVFSKLLKAFERRHPGSVIISFSDNRWSLGEVYSKNGFEKVGDIEPGYYVTDYQSREHKYNWRKNRIASRFGVSFEGKTELELTLELGYDRIWDCGKVKWRKIATM